VAQATVERPSATWARGARPGSLEGPPERAEHAPRLVLWVLITFIVLEYIRPPVLSNLKIQMLSILALPVLWLLSPSRPWHRILTYQALFLAWCIKSIPIASNWYSAYSMSRQMYGTLAVTIALVWVGSNLRDLRRLIWLWLGAMTYQAIWALTHGGRGTGGMLGDENDLALACCTALPFALAGAERLRGRTRIVLAGLAGLMIAAIVASFSRGGFVGLVLSVGYLIFSSRQRARALAVVAAGGMLLLALAPQEYIDELYSIQQTDEGTAKGRKFLWTAAWRMYLDHPVFGVGAANSKYLIGRYQPSNFEGREYVERDWSGLALHSAWFTLLSEQGTGGTLIFGGMLLAHFSIVRRLRREVRARSDVPDELARQVEWLGVALNSAMVAYMGCGTFLSVLYYPFVWYFTAFAAAFDLAVRRELARLGAPPPAAAARA
jgi:O-antigen ligase